MPRFRRLVALLLAATLLFGWHAAAAPVCLNQAETTAVLAGGDCHGCEPGNDERGCAALNCAAPCAAGPIGVLRPASVVETAARVMALPMSGTDAPLTRPIRPDLPPPR